MTKKAQNTGRKKSSSGKRKRRSRKKTIKIGVKTTISLVAAFLLTLALFVLWPYFNDRSSADKGPVVPAGNYCYGIDISYYQNDIVWDSLMILTDASRRTTRSKMKAKEIKPVSFVFIKATEGSSMKDKQFRTHWENAQNHGIRRGAYHFFRSSKSGDIQARNFIKAVGAIGPNDLPPVLDIETIHKGCSHRTLNDRALKWLQAVEKHYGRKPIVYSSANFISEILSDEIKACYPIWVAHYDTEMPKCERWHIWQFTDKALVYGTEGFTDLNVCSPEFLKSL